MEIGETDDIRGGEGKEGDKGGDKSQGGRSVLGSVLSVIEEIRFLENGNRLVPKNFRNRAFRFSVILVRFRF